LHLPCAPEKVKNEIDKVWDQVLAEAGKR